MLIMKFLANSFIELYFSSEINTAIGLFFLSLFIIRGHVFQLLAAFFDVFAKALHSITTSNKKRGSN